MPGLISSHQQGAFASPVDGDPGSAAVVLANDNATATTTNAHDADATIHVQSSVLASRPAAGTAQRVWISTDGKRAYLDNGTTWDELQYLPIVGGTVTGVATLAGGVRSGAGTVSVPNVAATTLFSSSVAGMYIIAAHIGTSGGYSWAVYIHDGTAALLVRNDVGGSGSMSIAYAAGAFKATQSTGGTVNVTYTYTLAPSA